MNWMSGEQVLVGIIIIVVGGLLLTGGKRVLAYMTDAVAAALVQSINGQLGLDAIRSDVTAMKDQMQTVSEMRTQIENLEGQIEAILTDL